MEEPGRVCWDLCSRKQILDKRLSKGKLGKARGVVPAPTYRQELRP
jgi:hypothetical protein